MTPTDEQIALQLAEDSKKLHEEFLAWWFQIRAARLAGNRDMEEWELQNQAWIEFKKWRGK
jgi:hypothetical protein